MLNISAKFKNELYNDNRDYLCYADITLVDGTVLNLKNEDIWTDSFSIEDAVSGTGSFDIGAAIINKLTLSINNIYEAYSEYDFTGAVVVPYIGLKLSDGTVEKLRKGVFTVDEASYDGALISLSCLDNMHKLDYAYSESSLSYPATLGEIVRDACFVCGVTLQSAAFFNSSYVVQNRPNDESLTFRQVLSWAAQIACSWARFDSYGRLRLDWYDLDAFKKVSGLDGGVFDSGSPYQTGDAASGGTFKPWTDGDNISGGTFQDWNSYHHIYSMSSMQLCMDDVVITGLRVTESFEETDTDKAQSFLLGTEGYVLAVEGNDLIQQGAAEAVARSIGAKVVGMRFRPFDVSALNDPSMEAGDPVIVTDRKQRSYQSYITSTTFKPGNYQQVRCSARTPSRNSAQRFTDATRNIVKAKMEAARKISDYEKAMQMLTSLIAQSFGVFKTEEKLEDGSTIFYLHNKPNLNESMTIWKMTADAFAVTTDGGKTWNAGMDSEGNVVVNVLSAIGINAEWINAGELLIRDGNGNVTLLANVHTGRVVINAESIAISGKSVQDIASSAASGAVDAQTQTDIFNKLTSKGTLKGIFMKDGQLYINATYLLTGTLTDGVGKNSWNLETGEFSLSSESKIGGKTIGENIEDGIDAQTQTDIFNKLTSNGALKGIFMKDGELYINASYLLAGILTDGAGKNFWNLETGAFSLKSCQMDIEAATDKEYPIYIEYTNGDRLCRALTGANGFYFTVDEGVKRSTYMKMAFVEDAIVLEGGSYLDEKYGETPSAGGDWAHTDSGDPDYMWRKNRKMSLASDGQFKADWIYENTQSGGANVRISSNGFLYRNASSSRRYKMDESTDLGDINPHGLYNLPVKVFRYRPGYLIEGDPWEGKLVLGFIVEDMLETFPQAVQYEDGLPEMWNDKVMIPAMLKLIQEQHEEIEDLKMRVEKLEQMAGKDGV